MCNSFAAGVRLQCTVPERDSNPVYRVAGAWHGRHFRPVHQGLYLHTLCTVQCTELPALNTGGTVNPYIKVYLYLVCTFTHNKYTVFRLWCTTRVHIATLPPFGPIGGHKWFDQISSQWESQENRFALIYFGKIQFLPPCIWNLPFMSYRLSVQSCLRSAWEAPQNCTSRSIPSQTL
jgi:hypothetical protein